MITGLDSLLNPTHFSCSTVLNCHRRDALESDRCVCAQFFGSHPPSQSAETLCNGAAKAVEMGCLGFAECRLLEWYRMGCECSPGLEWFNYCFRLKDGLRLIVSIVTLRKGEIQLLQSTMIGLVLSNILFVS